MIAIPTLLELYNSIVADIETQYGESISPFGKSALRALAAVQAAKLKLYYLVIGNLQKNIFVDTADSEAVGGTLERFGRVKIGRNPFPAVAGQYAISVVGSIGAVIKASTTFKSDDTSANPGYLFILDSEYILVAENDTITVRALTTGTDSKLNVLDTLTATSPIALVNSSVAVSSITTEALAAETTEAYRTAVLNSYRLEAQGGATTDYRLWSQDAQGVERVYPFAKSGASNEINVFVEATIVDSIDSKGTPSASLLEDVAEVIEFSPDTTLPLLERGRRPLGVFDVHVLPVTIINIDIVINGFQGLTPSIQTLLLTALTNAVTAIRPFVSAADILSEKNDIIDVNKIIGIIISQQPGAIFTTPTIEIDGVPLLTYRFLNGSIPYLNSVTYA